MHLVEGKKERERERERESWTQTARRAWHAARPARVHPQHTPTRTEMPVQPYPPWRHPRGKYMVSLVNSHSNATSRRWHLLEIDLRFAPRLPPWWCRQPVGTSGCCSGSAHAGTARTHHQERDTLHSTYDVGPRGLRASREGSKCRIYGT
jgi:hypothetical protein